MSKSTRSRATKPANRRRRGSTMSAKTNTDTAIEALECAAAILNAATRRDQVTAMAAYNANVAVHVALRALGAAPCPDMSPKRVAGFLKSTKAVST